MLGDGCFIPRHERKSASRFNLLFRLAAEAYNSLPESLRLTDKPASGKAVDVLVDALTETLRSIDNSILLVILAGMFIFVHGVQDDFVRDLDIRVRRVQAAKVRVEAATADASQSSGAEAQLQRTTIPVLGAEAELFTAGFIALVLEWVFTIRAALRTQQLNRICARLADLDAATLAVAVLFPSLATGTSRSKAWLCIFLGALGFASCLLFYYPLDNRANREITERIMSALIMLIPPTFLFYQLRKFSASVPPPAPISTSSTTKAAA